MTVHREPAREAGEAGDLGVGAARSLQRGSDGERRRGPNAARLRSAGLVLGFATLSSACQQHPVSCDQSVSTVRQAISLRDFAAARQWREYTWKICDERAVVATLDKEILDAEAALAAELEAAAKKAKDLAQTRINRAQSLWLKFDARPAKERTRESLDATHKSAKRLERSLTPEYSAKLREYNAAEYQKRLAALAR